MPQRFLGDLEEVVIVGILSATLRCMRIGRRKRGVIGLNAIVVRGFNVLVAY
jgi:hypothetical protein